MAQVRRKTAWPQLLRLAIEDGGSRPFFWGEHDCCMFACNAIESMTGVDPAKPFRGRYKTERGALLALRRYINRDPETGQFDAWEGRDMGALLTAVAERITSKLEMPEIAPLTAQRGDVVLVSTAQGPALAIVDMTGRFAAAAAADGIARIPLGDTIRAWRVG